MSLELSSNIPPIKQSSRTIIFKLIIHWSDIHYMSFFMREFHVTYSFHLKNEDWGCSQRTSGKNLSHQSLLLSPPPNWLVSLTQSSWFKMWVCLTLPEMLGGVPCFSGHLWYLTQLKTPSFWYEFHSICWKVLLLVFLSLFYISPQLACFWIVSVFTFKQIIICKLLPTFHSSKFK